MGARTARIASAGWGAPRWARAVAAAVAVLAAAPALAQSLERKVNAALTQARLGNATVGVSVYDVQAGTELVRIQPANAAKRAFIPASNLKLLTSGAALLALGPDFEYRTEIVQDADRVIVRGCGDPAFADPELLGRMKLSVDEFLDGLVQRMTAAGASGVREVIVDDRVFDHDTVHPDWPPDQLGNAYCAEVSGFNFYANLISVYISPARTEPSAPWIVVKRQAKAAKQKGSDLWLQRDDVPFTFTLRGTYGTPPDKPIQTTVRRSGLMFGRLLADRLGQAGLGSNGVAPTARMATMEETLPEGRVVAAVRTPLRVVLDRCNVDSDNLYAECLLKTLAHRVTNQPGSWSGGAAVVRMQLRDRLGPEYAAGLVMADGSGLSRNNRVTPDMLTRWLALLASDAKVGEAFVDSLAVAKEEGTLKRRFRGKALKNEIRAKSGYIRQVRTLSGYVINPATGRQVAFSVLVNDVPVGMDMKTKEFHESVVGLIDEWLTEQTPHGPGNEKVGG